MPTAGLETCPAAVPPSWVKKDPGIRNPTGCSGCQASLWVAKTVRGLLLAIVRWSNPLEGLRPLRSWLNAIQNLFFLCADLNVEFPEDLWRLLLFLMIIMLISSHLPATQPKIVKTATDHQFGTIPSASLSTLAVLHADGMDLSW